MMQQKWIGCFLLSSLLSALALSSSRAVDPDWYVQASKTRYFLQEERPLLAGHYTGEGMELYIGTTYLEPKPAQMELTFPPGTVLEDVMLTTSGSTTLNLRNCTLRRVAFKMGVKGTINLQSCALESCYVSYKDVVYGTNDGRSLPLELAYAQFGAPKLNMTDCVVAKSTLVSPLFSGLMAKRCSFLSCAIEASSKDGKRKNPSYVQCSFTASKLSGIDALLSASQCRFSECECPNVLEPNAGSHLDESVLVQLAWEKGTPALPLMTANGKVHFEELAATAEAGSALKHQWDGSSLRVTDLSPITLPNPQPLREVWKLGDYAVFLSKASTTQSPGGMPPAGRAVIAGAPAPAGVAFQSRINQVNGLLISQLSSGGEAGQVTRMNLTALPSLGQAPSTLKFNQDVGESMGKALNEVSKYSQLRHGGWPVGHALEIGFEDKYIGKDGPSAAVACALLLEAAITGKKWDPTFAVTGDMNADGSVQPIGGVQAKIRGATKGDCKLIGVPVKNEKAVMDILVLEGPAPLVGITVFGIKTFEDALLLASTERSQTLQNALTDFDNMRAVMLRDPRQMVPLLRTPHAAQRLQALLAAAPNCYSAKYLLMYVQGRAPRTLSIGGSIEAAQSSADSIVSAIEHDVDTNMTSLKGDELGNSLNKLRTLRPLLDARVWPYVDNLVAYGEVIRGSVLNPVRSGARYVDLVGKANKAAGGAKAAYEKLINDVQVREELGL